MTARRYRNRPVIVEAEQFDPERQPWPEGVRSVPGVRRDGTPTTLYFFDQTERDSFFPDSQYLVPGDYIMTGPRGERSVVGKAVFEAVYEPIVGESDA